MRKLTQPNNNSSNHYYNKNRTSSQQPIPQRSQEFAKKISGKQTDNQQLQNITSLSPSYSNQMLLSPGNKSKGGVRQNLNNYYHQQPNQSNQQGQPHHTQTSISSGSTVVANNGQYFHTYQNQNNQDLIFSKGGISDKLSGIGGSQALTQSQAAASQMSSYLNQYHTHLNKQSIANPIQKSNQQNHNFQSNDLGHQNQQFIGGTHSKKNSQSNILQHKKSPQSQLNDIVLQNNRVQSNLGQKGIDYRYQKDQQVNQKQQLYFLQDEQLNNRQIVKGDGIGKFQNELKQFNQIIQNVERESFNQKEQNPQQYNVQYLNFQQLNQINKINSPQSQLQIQNISHRQSIMSTSDDMKKSGVQGYQQIIQNQHDYDSFLNNHINQIVQSNQEYNNSNSINNNHDPNNLLKVIAIKLKEIKDNFQSPGKKINTTSSSSQGNYPTIPPSAMKNSNTQIQNSQTYNSSMQSSRHASGNLYAATAAGGQQLQQNKQEIGQTHQNSLKYSQMINTDKHIIGDKFIIGDKVVTGDISDEIIQNNCQIQQFNQQQIPIMQFLQDQSLQHQSPAKYLPNAYTKTQPQSLVTSLTVTQKKSNIQNYQLQGKNNNQAVDSQNSENVMDQEVKPFITDRTIYNQISSYQQQAQGQQIKMNSQQNNQNTIQNKQPRKGAFNNTLTKKKRHEMKEYRHFSSIDFKNSEQNSLIANHTYHNHNTSNSNNPNNINPIINPNYSYMQNISQSNLQNQNNSSSTNNTQRQIINSFITSTTKPLISIQEKHQLMQANYMISNIAGHLNINHEHGNQMNQVNQLQNMNESLNQEFNVPQEVKSLQQIGSSHLQSVTGMTNSLLVSQNKQQNNGNTYQSEIGVIKDIKNGNNTVSKQIQSINQALLIQKQENSPIANISNRAINSNRSTTQRTQSNIILNGNQQQIANNPQNNQNNLNNNQPLNSAKSSGGSVTSTKSGNKAVIQRLQPSSQQTSSNGNVNPISSQSKTTSTTNTTNTSIQNKQIPIIHNTNQNMQNNYLLNQKAGRFSNQQSSTLDGQGSNSCINGSNSFGKLTSNLFGNISMNGSNLGKANTYNNNVNTTSSPSTQNVVKNSSNSLNIKISKQLQYQSQQNQQQMSSQQGMQISQAYKKQAGSTSFGGLQQPMSAKSGEQQIKERRKHSESTAIHSQSANNSNLMMIANLSQGKYFEEDFVKESSLPYYKNQQVGDRTSSKNSLKNSSMNHHAKNSKNNQHNENGIIKKGFQQQQGKLQGSDDSSTSPQLQKQHQIQKMLNIGNHINQTKTPDRDRFPSNTSITNQLKSNSKLTQDSKSVNTPKTNSSQQKNLIHFQNSIQHNFNLNPGIVNQSRNNIELYQLNDNQAQGEVFENNVEEDQALLFLDGQFKNREYLQNQLINNPTIKLLQEQIHSNNQEFTHHFNQFDPNNDLSNFQNEKNINQQNILPHQVQQQNYFQNQNPPANQVNKISQTNNQNNQFQQQQYFQTNQNQRPILNESNNIGSLGASKTNTSHQSSLNPTNNSFYNQIKQQTNKSVIPNPSQDFHTVETGDKIASFVYYDPQQNDERMGDNNEQVDLIQIPIDSILSHSTVVTHPHFRTFSHENILSQNQNFVHNQTINEQILELDNQIQGKQDSYENQRSYLQKQNYNACQNLPTTSYSGEENMQNLEKALQQQNITQIKHHQSLNQISQTYKQQNNVSNTDDIWREINYKQQEQDLKQFENASVKKQKTDINNTIQLTMNKVNTNLKQQLEECNSNLPLLLANMLNGLEKSAQKKPNYIVETSNKKRTKTPQNQNNKVQQTHFPLSCTHKRNQINSDDINMSLSSSTKKNKNSLPKFSPSNNTKINNKNPRYQQKQPISQKNNLQFSNQKYQAQNRSPSQIMSSSAKKSRGSQYSSLQSSPKTDSQKICNFKLNDILDELQEEQNIQINIPVVDDEQFQFYNETIKDQEQLQYLIHQHVNNIKHSDYIQNHNHVPAQNIFDMGIMANNNNNINLFDQLKSIDQDFSNLDHNKFQKNYKNGNPLLQENQLQCNDKQTENKFNKEGLALNNKIKHQFENNNYSDVVINQDSFIKESFHFNAELDQTLSDHKHKINCIYYNKQDNIIFTGSHDYNLKVFTQQTTNSQNFSCSQTIRHRRWVTSLEYMICHRLLLSGGGDGIIKIFNLSNNQQIQNSIQQNQNKQGSQLIPPNALNMSSFVKGHSGVISGIKFQKNENGAFSTCSSDGFVHIWDLENLKIKTSWQIGSPVQQLEYLPQSNMLMNLNQSNLSIMDIRTKGLIVQRENSDFMCIRSLPSLQESFLVGTGKYSNLNQYSTSGSQSQSASILQFDMRKNILDPTFIYQPFNGSHVNCIETYEDKNICIFGTDQSLEYLNLVNNKIYILDSQTPSVNCLSIDPVHNRIYSGLANNDLRIYNII